LLLTINCWFMPCFWVQFWEIRFLSSMMNRSTHLV
jgi:hypothetical protein